MTKPPDDSDAPPDDEPKRVEIQIVDIGDRHYKTEPPIDPAIAGWMDELSRRKPKPN